MVKKDPLSTGLPDRLQFSGVLTIGEFMAVPMPAEVVAPLFVVVVASFVMVAPPLPTVSALVAPEALPDLADVAPEVKAVEGPVDLPGPAPSVTAVAEPVEPAPAEAATVEPVEAWEPAPAAVEPVEPVEALPADAEAVAEDFGTTDALVPAFVEPALVEPAREALVETGV